MFQPVRIGALELKNRVVVSPMDMYSAVDGVPGDFHLVHLGSKALGGAGLVMTEMVCVSPEGRITPGCTGLWNDEQRDAWRARRVRARAATAQIGLQLGHSGRKGSTKLMWEGMDEPLDEGNWAVIGPSPLPYGDGCHVPREATRADMDQVVAEFAAAAGAARQAGSTWSRCTRARLPAVVLPVAAGQPAHRRVRRPAGEPAAVPARGVRRGAAPVRRAIPVTVRISATDWLPDGNTERTRWRSPARSSRTARPRSTSPRGRSPRRSARVRPLVPDAVRGPDPAPGGRPAGAAVIAVGAIASYDDVNSILLAGRADLCALGRTHLYDPQWTLQAAAEQEYRGPRRASGREQFGGRARKPPTARTDKVRPRLALLREATPRTTCTCAGRPGRVAAEMVNRVPGGTPGRANPAERADDPRSDTARASAAARNSRTVLVSFLGAIVRRMGNWMPIAGTIELMAQFGLDGPSVRTAVFRLKKRGWLASETRAGIRGYALTPVALKALAAGDEIIWHARQPADLADGWCIVNFSVPESARAKRHQLRAHLASLGFGNVGTAMWIAPARMRAAAEQAIAELGLTGYSAIFVGDYVGGQDLPRLVYDSWDLAEIDRRYREFIAPLRRTRPRQLAPPRCSIAGNAFLSYLGGRRPVAQAPVPRPRTAPRGTPGDWSAPAAGALFEALVSALDTL